MWGHELTQCGFTLVFMFKNTVTTYVLVDYWKLYCSLTNPLPCVNDVITIKHLLVENVHYLGQFKRLNRHTHTQKVWTALLSTAASWLRFQTNLPGTARILMLGACLPIYVCLLWIQGTSRAEKAWLICVSHDTTTATIDKRSCENLLQDVPGEYEQNNPHLNTCHKLYTISVNEVTVGLCSMDFLQLAEKSNTTATTMVSTEKGSCWSRDFLLSLRLRAKNVYSGFRNWLMKWFRVHIAFCLCFTMKQSSYVFFFPAFI